MGFNHIIYISNLQPEDFLSVFNTISFIGTEIKLIPQELLRYI